MAERKELCESVWVCGCVGVVWKRERKLERSNTFDVKESSRKKEKEKEKRAS